MSALQTQTERSLLSLDKGLSDGDPAGGTPHGVAAFATHTKSLISILDVLSIRDDPVPAIP